MEHGRVFIVAADALQLGIIAMTAKNLGLEIQKL
jgi:hypothetical protein